MRLDGLRKGLEVMASVAMLVAAVFVVATNYKKVFGTDGAQAKTIEVPRAPIPVGGLPTQGRDDAKVAILEFSDFQCPYCGLFAREILPKILDKYVTTGRVRMSFQYLPLEDIHKLAIPAATVAACAFQQLPQSFWTLHDAFFSQKLTQARMEEAVRKVPELDQAKLDACVAGDGERIVRAGVTSAHSFGLSGTPAFFIGTIEGNQLRVSTVINGARPLSDFTQALDKLIGQ